MNDDFYVNDHGASEFGALLLSSWNVSGSAPHSELPYQLHRRADHLLLHPVRPALHLSAGGHLRHEPRRRSS